MLPTRMTRKSFRERKVPNIQYYISNSNLTGQNTDPHLYQTQVMKNLKSPHKQGTFGVNKSLNKQVNNNLNRASKQYSINGDVKQLLKQKLNMNQIQNCFIKINLDTQSSKTSQLSTKKLGQNSQKFKTQTELNKDYKAKNEFAQKIIDEIQGSFHDTKRSFSVMSKSRTKKKKMVQQCKVVKIPWKSKTQPQSKNKFNPQISMIFKNLSIAPMDSLKQICDNI